MKRFCDIKPRSFNTAKESGSSVKRQPRQRDKIFASHVTDSRPISKTNKEFLEFNGRNKLNFKAGQEH